MKRPIVIAMLCLFVFVGLTGCSHYPDDFAAEPMVIFQLDVIDVTTSTATFVWKTSKKGTSEVHYKRASSFEKFVIDDTKVLEHRVTLTDLFPQREYICRVASRNDDGYFEEWEDIIFNTKPDPAVLPPPAVIR